MTTKPTRTRRPRGSIDAEMILTGAFEVARREGLDKLSMPGLAAHLGVGVTSLYWYYKNKDELLRQMYSTAVAKQQEQMLLPDSYAPEEWRTFLRKQFIRARARFSSDEVLSDLMHSRIVDYDRDTTLFLYGRIENTLEYLVGAGFSALSAWQLQSALSIFTRGFVSAERARKIDAPGSLAGPSQLSLLDVPSMPLLSKLVTDEGIVLDGTGETNFLTGLDLMLEAAERTLEADKEASAAHTG